MPLCFVLLFFQIKKRPVKCRALVNNKLGHARAGL